MDRLDPDYSMFKRASKDASLSEQEQAQAAEKLAEREKHLQPIFQQLALLYADLHE